MVAATTKAVSLKDYVEEGAISPDHFQTIEVECPSGDGLQDGEVLAKLEFLSVDPYMRGRMRNAKGYMFGPFVPGEPLEGRCIARLLASKAQHLPTGSHIVSDALKWQEVQVIGKEAAAKLKPLDTDLGGVSLTAYLGPLGMVGLTAYSALHRIAKPKQGETAYVSGAAGGVGYIVGQLLRNVHGCQVVGSAGSDEKVEWLKRIGYTNAFNYKSGNPREALREQCPKGVDIYWDNVGGAALDECLRDMNNHGRVVACGAISEYDKKVEDRYGIKHMVDVVFKRLLIQGFIVGDLADEQMLQQFHTDMAAYLKEGKVTVEEVVVHGLENAGKAFSDMMKGGNMGKMIVKI